MNVEDNIISLPCNYEVNDFTSDIAKVTLKVFHNGLNLNNSFFDDECFDRSKDSFKNKPIVGNIIYEEDGSYHWGGHDIEESPQGVIIESNNYRTEYDENEEKTFAIVDGVIFKHYCPDAYKLLKGKTNTDISMEILPTDYYLDDDDIIHIREFRLLCVTILDDSPAMKGAKINLFSKSEKSQLDSFAEKFSLMIDRANKIINELELKEGGNGLKRDEIISKFSSLEKLQEYKTIIENTELTDVELEKELFALSNNQIESFVRESLESEKIIKTYWDGEAYETSKYLLEDVILSDNIVIAYSKDDNKFYGIPFTMNGDVATLDYKNCKRYVYNGWREYQEGTKEIEDLTFSVEKEIKMFAEEYIKKTKESFKAENTSEYKDLNDKYSEIKAEKDNLETEVKSLREFKQTKDLEVRIDAENQLFSQYDGELGEIESYKKIKEEKSQYSLDELEMKCFAEYGKFMKKNKPIQKNFSNTSNDDGFKLDSITNVTNKGVSSWDILEKI